MSGTAALIQSLANPPNPLVTLGQDVQGVGAVRNFQAQQATAQAYQQSIDPQTGAFDQGKFNRLIASTPQGAWNAGPAIQQAGSAMTSTGLGQQEQLAAQLAKIKALSGLATPLLQRANAGQSITPGDVDGVIQQGLDSGIISPEDATFARAKLNQPGTNPRDLLLGWNFANQSAEGQLSAATPGTTGIPTAGGTQFVGTNPYMPGYPRAGTFYPGGEIVSVNMGDGTTQQMPIAQANTLLGNPAVRAANPNGFTPAPVTNKSFTTPDNAAPPGRYPQPAAPPPAPLPTDQAVAAARQSGQPVPILNGNGLVARPDGSVGNPAPTTATAPPGRTLAPGVAAARAAPAEASGQAQTAFRADVASSPGRVMTAQQALSALQGSMTGPGTQWANSLAGIIGTWEPGVLKNWLGPNYDPATLSQNRALAEKYLTAIAQQTAAGFGHNTDAQLAAAFSANPNVHISNLAAQDVLKVQIGLERMKQDMYDDMRGQRVQPEDFADWQANWANTHDPRAYVVDSMAPDQLQRLQASLNREGPKAQRMFVQTAREAFNNGRIPDPFGGALTPSAQAGQ